VDVKHSRGLWGLAWWGAACTSRNQNSPELFYYRMGKEIQEGAAVKEVNLISMTHNSTDYGTHRF
jgi:hypothetical protein